MLLTGQLSTAYQLHFNSVTNASETHLNVAHRAESSCPDNWLGIEHPINYLLRNLQASATMKQCRVYRVRANRYTVRYTIEGKAPHSGSSQNTIYI